MTTKFTEDMPSGYYWFRTVAFRTTEEGEVEAMLNPDVIIQVTDPEDYYGYPKRMVKGAGWRETLGSRLGVPDTMYKLQGPIPEPEWG